MLAATKTKWTPMDLGQRKEHDDAGGVENGAMVDDETAIEDDDQVSVAMPNKDGNNFLCFLPKVEKTKTLKSVTQQNTSSLIVESEKRVKLKTPDELLEQEGWWSYEFCYQKQLRQLHVEMKRGDTPFCSAECRQEQIDMNEAMEKNRNHCSSMRALRKKDQRKSEDYPFRPFRTGTVAAA
ncbi:Protein OS-9-like protein [Hibiscus syriacus]|uniref:Protein OS-9-like protein n=1 Tax=Hibiscus syriacus TaxID=106335 RepID=A0A6A2WC13_HIBSY|nr:Protein OS-9-like protein [Hibiscus syriacus]